MLAHYEQSVQKILPIWSHYSNENWCMIGYHAVSVIADAYLKGIRNYDVDEAFNAVISSSNYAIYDGNGYYKKYGYVPENLSSNSASKTLEYAYDDWAIYRFAKALGKTKENIYLTEVKLNGKNINRNFITHKEIINGGELKFIMSNKPNKNRAVDKDSFPYSMSN